MPEALSPLDVLKKVMQEHFDAGEYDKAAAVARSAAPYVHGRRAAVRDLPAAVPQRPSDRLIQAPEEGDGGQT